MVATRNVFEEKEHEPVSNVFFLLKPKKKSHLVLSFPAYKTLANKEPKIKFETIEKV